MRAMDRRTWLREALDAEPVLLSNQLSPEGMDRCDCDAWIPDCERWMLTKCIFEDRASQSISSLHVAFCEWAIRHHSVPCRRDVFEQLLAQIGVLCDDGFAIGLMLASDLRVLKESVTQ
jgi:hypothetical protein